jgi:hypothetical protein
VRFTKEAKRVAVQAVTHGGQGALGLGAQYVRRVQDDPLPFASALAHLKLLRPRPAPLQKRQKAFLFPCLGQLFLCLVQLVF